MAEAFLEEKDTANLPPEDDLSLFLREIRRYPLLSREEEYALAKKCLQGDEDAIRTMVNSNLRLVVSIAKEYAGRGVPLLDLIQEGSIGLLSAARNYDYTQNCRFSAYARRWIRQGVDRCVLNHAGVIRVPLHTMEKIRKVHAVKNTITQQTGEEPPVEMVALRSGLTPEKTNRLLAYQPQVCSLDAPAGDDSTIRQLLEDQVAAEPYKELVSRELQRTMELLLSQLPQRQSLVLKLHFGMEDGVCHSLDEIGAILGVSKERARQIEGQAMTKLKKLGTDLGLEDFLK